MNIIHYMMQVTLTGSLGAPRPLYLPNFPLKAAETWLYGRGTPPKRGWPYRTAFSFRETPYGTASCVSGPFRTRFGVPYSFWLRNKGGGEGGGRFLQLSLSPSLASIPRPPTPLCLIPTPPTFFYTLDLLI
jgi:hypothetical protein